jgi:hypothetical protein
MGDRSPTLRLMEIRNLETGDTFEIHTAGGIWKALDLICVMKVSWLYKGETGTRHQTARECERMDDGYRQAFPLDWPCRLGDRADG